MMDSIMETYPDGKAPEQLEKRRDQILQERDELKAKVCFTHQNLYFPNVFFIQVDVVVEILERDSVKEMMETTRERDGNNKLLDYLMNNHGVCITILFLCNQHYDSVFRGYARYSFQICQVPVRMRKLLCHLCK